MRNNSMEWIGKRFDRLVITDFVHAAPPNREWLWECKCDCGNIKVVRPTDVKLGKIHSCGCLHREASSERATKFEHMVKHNRRLYSIYRRIKNRCYLVTDPCYKDYGARGIQMAAEWSDASSGFDRFVEWSVTNGYADGMTIDLIDANGNYAPDNCRWIPLPDRPLNKRDTVWVEYKGNRVQLLSLCESVGANYNLVYRRIYLLNWSVESAVDTPSRGRKTK